MIERGLMLGTVDTFDFVLASDLGQPLHAVRSWPNADLVAWRAYYTYRNAMDELAAKTAGGG